MSETKTIYDVDWVYSICRRCGEPNAGSVDMPYSRQFISDMKWGASERGDTIVVDPPSSERVGRMISCRCEPVPGMDTPIPASEPDLDARDEAEWEDAPLPQEDRG